MEGYQQLLESTRAALDVHENGLEQLSDAELRKLVSQTVRSQLSRQAGAAEYEPDLVVRRVLDDLVGLGPLEALLRDPQVSEIMVNCYNQIFIERAGQLQLASEHFPDEAAVRRTIDRIVVPLGRRIDDSSPMVDARLADGSRVNAVIPPLALKGSCLTIRKFPEQQLTIDDLCRGGSCSEELATVLRVAVQERKNLVVCGGTGSGKTTLLNVLARWVPTGERVITIEDAAELQLAHDNLIRLESRPANQEGEGAVAIRQLVINALRMRPDRIIVGECRGGESLDMLQAMNTGHSGSMTTLHANTPRDGIRRLETMVLMSGLELPLPAIRQQICGAVDLLVQVARLADGRRRITSLTELQGSEGDMVQLAEIFRFDRLSDQHIATGEFPRFAQQLPPDQQATVQQALQGGADAA